MAEKRPHKTLTLAEKQNILQKLDSGVSGKVLAKKYGIGTSTISDIKKNKEKIMGYIENYVSTTMRRRILRKSEYPEMENELYKWFQLQHERHISVTTYNLKKKAMQIYSKYYNDKKFTASSGWVTRFKNRHGIRQLKVVNEKLSNGPSDVQPLQKFTEKMNELNLLPSQIYNVVESTLFWKQLPDWILEQSGERTDSELKILKKRVTFLTCTNGDGTHKVKMLVIGKERNSRAFENYANLPVEFYSTKNNQMTSAQFVKWFHDSFVAQVKKFQVENNLNGKAILLINNVSSHAAETQFTSDDGQIKTMFLPSDDCTPIIQPLNQNLIHLIKLHYRKSLLIHILSLEKYEISKILKNITLKDALFFLANSWDKLSPDLIAKCWQNIFFYSVCNDLVVAKGDSDDEIPLSSRKERLLSIERAEEFAEIENMLQQINTGNCQPKESDIFEWIVGDEDRLPLDSEDSSSDEEIINYDLNVKHENAEEVANYNFVKHEETDEVANYDLNVKQEVAEEVNSYDLTVRNEAEAVASYDLNINHKTAEEFKQTEVKHEETDDDASYNLNVKHEEAIRSFNTCIQWAEENRVELNNLIILRILRQRAMEANQSGCYS